MISSERRIEIDPPRNGERPVNDIQEIQAGAPAGVVVTSDPRVLPSYLLEPELRTPLRRCADGRLELLLLAQDTADGYGVILSVPDVLGINGESQIGLQRANRIMQAGQTEPSQRPDTDDCNICKALSSREVVRPAFEMDNFRPFGPLLHKVVSSCVHRKTLLDVSLAEVRDATELFYEIAQRGVTFTEHLDGLTIGMNFGDHARSGASQIHFHYQVAGLGRANYNAGDRLGALCRVYRHRHAGCDFL
jgi:hypothetical protein